MRAIIKKLDISDDVAQFNLESMQEIIVGNETSCLMRNEENDWGIMGSVFCKRTR